MGIAITPRKSPFSNPQKRALFHLPARAFVFLSVLLSSAGAAAAAARPPQATGISVSIPVGGGFELQTLDGKTVTDKTYRGKWLLLYFGYTFCPDVCPTTLNEMGNALKELGPLANRIQPLFITVDPVRDTQKVMRDYMKSFDHRIVGLRGDPEQIEAVAKEFHVYYRPRALGNGQYTVDHSSFVYVMNPQGKFVHLLTSDVPGHKMAQELRPLIK
jgi:protein SCO1